MLGTMNRSSVVNVPKTNVVATEMLRHKLDENDYWLARFLINIMGYSIVILPFWVLLRYLERKNYFLVPEGGNACRRFMVLFFKGRPVPPVGRGLIDVKTSDAGSTRDIIRHVKPLGFWLEALILLAYMGGLLGSYLVWGIMQEKIMTQPYQPSHGNEVGHFRDSQFLVLCNRFSAFLLSGVIIMLSRTQPVHRSPLFKYSFASLSNIMSSWCQYEALKFISFPTQVLGKVSKIIPVMLMGRLVMRKSYPWNQYATALMISMGVGMFLYFKGEHSRRIAESTTISGVLLMAGYLLFDSFTSNWQGQLFSQYAMSPFQMMCGVNAFSSTFTLVSELIQGRLGSAVGFLMAYPAFLRDLALISLCSATGQIFIFLTISRFGVVTFTIMMTMRQATSIFLSCLIFGHHLSVNAILGVVVVFAAILLRTYLAQRDRARAAAGQDKA